MWWWWLSGDCGRVMEEGKSRTGGKRWDSRKVKGKGNGGEER